jgi:hypothetical protein
MATLLDSVRLSFDGLFRSRVSAAAVQAALNVMAETANEVQAVHLTGGTAGSFTLTNLPGVSVTQTGTLTSAAATVTGLASTTGLAVGMAVSGTGVPAGATIATITSLTALTLSANSTVTGAQALTFTGGGTVSVPFNATAAQLQTLLGNQPSVGSANVVCTGGPLPGTDITVTFTGALGNLPLNLMTVGVNSVTGGTPSVARTTAGVAVFNHAGRQNWSRLVLGDPVTYGNLMALGVALNATVVGDFDLTNPGSIVPAAGKTEATISNDIQFAMNTVFGAYAS